MTLGQCDPWQKEGPRSTLPGEVLQLHVKEAGAGIPGQTLALLFPTPSWVHLLGFGPNF